ncbi:MAG: molybdopterin converting factor subunit 1 [Candidatus Saliniplasma sp.]
MQSTVNIRLKFFASAREIVGTKDLDMDIEKGSKAKDVLDRLKEKYPGLKKLDGQLILAVNKQTGRADKMIEDGDEIAVLPPVSGG